jgi:hypothetical protein
MKLPVDLFKTMNQIDDFTPMICSSSSLAKMGAACEGTIVVDRAACTLLIKQATGSITALRQLPSAGSAESLKRNERLSLSQKRGLAS